MADILSQEEIDALLDVIDEDNLQPLSLSSSDDILYKNNFNQITLYDFKRPYVIKRDEIRKIRIIHDKLCNEIIKNFDELILNQIELQLHSVDQMTYSEFLMSLPAPTSFNVVRHKNIQTVIEMNPNVVYSIIDKMLGGPGEINNSYKEFTDIELIFSKKILNYIVKKLNSILKMKYKLEYMESSPNIYKIFNSNDIVITIVFELIIGHSSGMINLCYKADDIKKIIDNRAFKDIK